MHRFVALSALVLSSLPLALAAGCSSSGKTVRVVITTPTASGEKGPSPYERFNLLLLNALEQHKERLALQIRKRPSSGSLDTLFFIDKLVDEPVERRQHGAFATSGSRSTTREYGLGLVQSDVLHHFTNGGHPQIGQQREFSNVRSMARLFEEWILLYFESDGGRTPNSIRTDNEAWSRALNAPMADGGNVGSGRMATVYNLGAVTNARWKSALHAQPTQFPEALTVAVEAPANQQPRAYIGMPESVAGTVVGAFGTSYRRVAPCNFDHTLLGGPACTKGSREHDASEDQRTTLALDAILVSSREMPADVVGTIMCTLDWWDRQACALDISDQLHCRGRHKIDITAPLDHSVAETLKDIGYCASSAVSGMSLQDAAASLDTDATVNTANDVIRQRKARESHRFDELPLRMHRAASVRRLDAVSQGLLQVNGRVMLSFFLFTSLLYLLIQRDRTSDVTLATLKQDTREALATIAPILGILLLGTVVLTAATWVAEFHSQNIQVNTDFVGSGFSGALLWVFQYIFTDSNDILLRSAWATIFFGLMKLLWTLASLAPAVPLIELLWKRRKEHARMNDHVIVVGFSDTTPTLFSELRKECEVTLLPLREIPEPRPPRGDERRVHVVENREKFDWEALSAADVTRASALVVVSDPVRAKGSEVSVDMLALQTLQTYRTLEQDHSREYQRGPRRVIVEVDNATNRELAQTIGACRWSDEQIAQASSDWEKDELLEAICARRRGSYLLSQAVRKPDAVRVFSELLENNAGNELYSIPVHELRRGHSQKSLDNYRQVQEFFQARADEIGKATVLPIGIHRAHVGRPAPTDSNSSELWQAHGPVIANPNNAQAGRSLLSSDRIIFIARERTDIVSAD